MYSDKERTSLGWEKVGEAWQKTFPIGEGSELTVIVGQQEGSVDGLAFKQRAVQDGTVEDRPGARLQDWMDSLAPEALIEIIAKRDAQAQDESDGS
jgi:hypothetical protein